MEVNPYAPPQRESRSLFDPSLPWYYVDFTAVTYRELWGLSPNLLAFVILAIRKSVRLRARAAVAFLVGQDQLISVDQVPEEARRKFQPLVEEALNLGFQVQAIRTMPHIGNANVFVTELVSGDGRTCLPIYYTRAWSRGVVQEVCVYCLLSQLMDDRVLLTISRKQQFSQSPQIVVAAFPRMTMAAVFAAHGNRLIHAESPVRMLDTEPLLREFMTDYDHIVKDFQIQRGVYKPISPAQVERLMAAPNQPPRVGVVHTVLQVVGAVWILLFTVILFFGIVTGNMDTWFGLPILAVFAFVLFSLAGSWYRRFTSR